MAAVIDAAIDLFAEKGPEATSIRDLAARSGVNHGLVYRHFGSKEQLVSAVLDHLSSDQSVLAQAALGPDEMEAAATRHLRVLMRAVLDGYPVGQLQHQFPFVSYLVEVARSEAAPGTDETEIRLRAGHAAALEFGWRLLEPFIRSATGLHDVERAAILASSAAAARSVLAAGAA